MSYLKSKPGSIEELARSMSPKLEADYQDKFKKELGVKVYSTSPLTLIRFFSSHNLNIKQIDRVIYGPITKKNLPRGKWRNLNKAEISLMNMF